METLKEGVEGRLGLYVVVVRIRPKIPTTSVGEINIYEILYIEVLYLKKCEFPMILMVHLIDFPQF